MVDMARHAISFGTGAVDVVAAQANFVPPSNCNVYAFNSETTNVPKWTWSMTNCDSSLLYDDYRMIDISDDGSTAAFSAFIPTGTTSAPLLTVFDGQSGAVRYSKSFAAGTGAGPVMVTENGNYVAWEAGTGLQIYDGKTGVLRDTIPGAGNAEVSDSGDFVAAGGESSVTIYKWNATNNAYSVAFTL